MVDLLTAGNVPSGRVCWLPAPPLGTAEGKTPHQFHSLFSVLPVSFADGAALGWSFDHILHVLVCHLRHIGGHLPLACGFFFNTPEQVLCNSTDLWFCENLVY